MRRISSIVVLMLGLVLIAGACGGGSDPDPTATTSAPDPTTGATPLPDASPTAETEEPTATFAPIATPTEATPEASPTSVISPTHGPWDANVFAHGFNVAWRADEEAQAFNSRSTDMVEAAGFTWVRVQIYWSEVQREPDWLDPLPIDLMVDEYSGQDVRILATVSKAPDWALDPTGTQLLADYAAWQEFMRFMADRYKGRIQAWEIWNEPNHAITVGGTVRVQDFCNLLTSGYQGIKAGDPNALAVMGGLTPTGVNDPAVAVNDLDYLRSLYQFEDGRCVTNFDVLGAHANATNNPPDTMWPDNPGTGAWSEDPSFYFRRVEQLRAVMAEFGDERPMWITEFGWTTENQAPGYEYGADNTEEEQAEYLVRAFEIARTEWPWCTGMFVWNLNFSLVVDPSDEKYPWAVLSDEWAPRPAYTALAAMPKE